MDNYDELRKDIREVSATLNSLQNNFTAADVTREHTERALAKLENKVNNIEQSMRTLENKITWFTGAIAIVATVITQLVSYLLKILPGG